MIEWEQRRFNLDRIYAADENYLFSLYFTHLSSLQRSFGNDGIPQSTILKLLTDVAFLRRTNCGLTFGKAHTFCPFSGAGLAFKSEVLKL